LRRSGTIIITIDGIITVIAATIIITIVPDLPGCVATNETRKEAERELREAVRFHLEGLRQPCLYVAQSR